MHASFRKNLEEWRMKYDQNSRCSPIMCKEHFNWRREEKLLLFSARQHRSSHTRIRKRRAPEPTKIAHLKPGRALRSKGSFNKVRPEKNPTVPKNLRSLRRGGHAMSRHGCASTCAMSQGPSILSLYRCTLSSQRGQATVTRTTVPAYAVNSVGCRRNSSSPVGRTIAEVTEA